MAHQLEPLVSRSLMEGPRWDGKDGLYFCDSLRGGIYHHTLKGETRNIVPKRKGVGELCYMPMAVSSSRGAISTTSIKVYRVFIELGEGARNDILRSPRPTLCRHFAV